MAKCKVQITMENELLNELDNYCDQNFMNRSWVISQAVLQVINQQKLMNCIQDLSLAMKKVSEVGTIDEDVKRQILEIGRAHV